MDAKSPTPRLLARPRLWWLTAAVIALCMVCSIVVRQLSARTQGDLLQRGGWEVHDLRLVDDRIESYDVVRGLKLASDGTLWVATDYIPLRFDGYHWEAYEGVDDWPFGHMRALVSSGFHAKAVDPAGQTWTGGPVCTYKPDWWCSCVITSQPEAGQVSLRFDLPDSSCGNVTSMAFDQGGRLWVGFWTDSRNESRFGLASYAGNQWTFYETRDIADPLLEAGSSLVALLVDSDGDLWLGLMSSPYVAKLRPTSSTVSTDPVPDRVAAARRTSNTLARTLMVLFCVVFGLAAWSTYLNSKGGLAWAQRLRAEAPVPTPGSRPAPRRLTVRILAPGILLVIWLLVNVIFIQKADLDRQGWSVVTGGLLMLVVIGFFAGVGAAALVSLGSHTVKSAPSPSRLVLGYLALVLGYLIFIACFGLTWFAVGMLATG